jgi:hypothetical protein
LCDGVAGCDAHSDGLNCGVVCCVGVMLWWCDGRLSVLGRPNPPTVIYLYLIQVAGVLTPLSMHLVSVLPTNMLASRLAWDLFPLRAVW